MAEGIGIPYNWPDEPDEPQQHQIWLPWRVIDGVPPAIPISSLDELNDCIERLGNSFIVLIDSEFPPPVNVKLKLLIAARAHDLTVISELPPVESESSQESYSSSPENLHYAPSDDEDHSSPKNQTLSEMACNRLHTELGNWQVNPPSGFNLEPSDYLQRWLIEVNGAPGTLYANETYQLQAEFPEHYPIKAPQVIFLPPAPLHPDIYRDGHICLDILYDSWSPTMTVSSICISILSMLSSSTVKFPSSEMMDVPLILSKHVFFSKFKADEDESNNANMVFSPVSIQIIFALIAAGSSGSTLDQLLAFLKFNSVEELNSVYSRVITDVLADGSPMGGPRLSVTNWAWVDQSLSFKHSFKQVMDNVYKAASASVDFRNKGDEVTGEVNKWAEEKTNGLIKQILPPVAVNSGTSLILANALYFKGAWTEKLNASDTKDHEFHLLNGGSVQAPLMTSKKRQYVKAFDGFQVLRLRYKQGEDKRFLNMYVYLPNARDGLPTLLEKISSEPGFLDRHVPYEKVKVHEFLIPKFKISLGIEALEVLKGLELTLPFKGGLTEMVGENYPLAVANVFHKAFIEVNEEGAEAPAAKAFHKAFIEVNEEAPVAPAVTVATMMFGCSMMKVEEEIDFVADHPFMFLVKDETAGVVLFVGTLLNPLAVSPS
ncbi:serpin-ZX isoform X1 [Nicotiana tabacum]|uniref:Serpin-ZX isoform X1 n=2 Tax=Nicotiana tabacum TaxID=4097 RepID=A0A1S3YK88_TOBAC|nr:PREDICTED: serpin-ZX-like isoform X1 [Nicotiana tabacum]